MFKKAEKKDAVSTGKSAENLPRPKLVQIGTLANVQAKSGSYGDHDSGYYYSRSVYRTKRD